MAFLHRSYDLINEAGFPSLWITPDPSFHGNQSEMLILAKKLCLYKIFYDSVLADDALGALRLTSSGRPDRKIIYRPAGRGADSPLVIHRDFNKR
jgi:hypothetical protein